MKTSYLLYLTLLILSSFLMFSCGPQSVNTEREDLNAESRSWIPYAGNETVVFEYDTNAWTFNGLGKEVYYDNVRYMSDQSGFFKVQEDYYADMERQELTFDSPSTPYFIKYLK